jgi:hypothetical protein
MQLSKLKIFIKKPGSIAVFVFLGALIVYIMTLAPTIFLEDSAELITAAATLGIPHPSGYPLYVLLGKIFSILSFGHPAVAVNFMSAFFAALTAALLSLIIQKLTHNRVIALSAGLLLVFSKTFWSLATVAEVYSLHTFLFLLLFLLWLMIRQTLAEKNIFWLAWLAGLALTNHLLTLLYLPVYFIYLLIKRKKFRNFGKVIFVSMVLAVVGLSLYLYLPFRSLQEPLLDWGNPETLQNFWAHVSRAQYNDISLIGVGNKLLLVQTFFTFITDELSWPLFATSIIGLGWLLGRRESRDLGFVSLGLFLTSGLAVILLRGFGWSIVVEEIFRAYYLPALMIVLIWSGLAFNIVWLKIVKRILLTKIELIKNVVQAALAVLLLGIPAGLALANWTYNDLSDTVLVENWSRQVLEELPEGAILLLKNSGFAHDTQIFSVAYQQYTQKLRPDILVVDDSGVFGLPVGVSLEKSYLLESLPEQQRLITEAVFSFASKAQRPFYANYPAAVLIPETRSISNGLVYLTLPTEAVLPEVEFIQLAEDETVTRRLSGRDFMASLYYSQAAGILADDFKASQAVLIQAIELDNEPESHEFKMYLKHRQQVLQK